MSEPLQLNDALIARLRQLYSQQEIADWADVLAQFQPRSLEIDDIVPDGTPTSDVLVMKARVPPAELAQAILQFQRHPSLRRIDILPDGIPMRDPWRVQVRVGLK